MRPRSKPRCSRRLAFAVLLACAATAITTAPAHAGQWVRMNCIYPDGSAAPSDGWTGHSSGAVSLGSLNRTDCGPDRPMIASLSNQAWAGGGAAQWLEYTPPDGSRLVGGAAFVGLAAYGFGYHALATAAMHTPDFDASSAFLSRACTSRRSGGAHPPRRATTAGWICLKARAGDLYLAAGCMAAPQHQMRVRWQPRRVVCRLGWLGGSAAVDGLIAHRVRIHAAHSWIPTPTARRVWLSRRRTVARGLQGRRHDRRQAGVRRDAEHAVGQVRPVRHRPGDRRVRWAWQQPCPRSQSVDLTVRTTTLRDGPHELKVTVQNAARDTQTVLRRTITVNNRTTVSSTLTSDRPATAIGAAGPLYAMELDAPTRRILRRCSAQLDALGHQALRHASQRRGSAGTGRARDAVRQERGRRHSAGRGAGDKRCDRTLGARGAARAVEAPDDHVRRTTRSCVVARDQDPPDGHARRVAGRPASRRGPVALQRPVAHIPSREAATARRDPDAHRQALGACRLGPAREQLGQVRGHLQRRSGRRSAGATCSARSPTRPPCSREASRRAEGRWSDDGRRVNHGSRARRRRVLLGLLLGLIAPPPTPRRHRSRCRRRRPTPRSSPTHRRRRAEQRRSASWTRASTRRPTRRPGLVHATALDGGTPNDVDPLWHGTIDAAVAGGAGHGVLGAWPRLKIVSVRATDVPSPGQHPDVPVR